VAATDRDVDVAVSMAIGRGSSCALLVALTTSRVVCALRTAVYDFPAVSVTVNVTEGIVLAPNVEVARVVATMLCGSSEVPVLASAITSACARLLL